MIQTANSRPLNDELTNSNWNSYCLFNSAISEYNRGFKEHALQMAQNALNIASHSTKPLLSSIHGLLSFIFEERGKILLARRHCLEAINNLNINQADYEKDKSYYGTMLEYIDHSSR